MAPRTMGDTPPRPEELLAGATGRRAWYGLEQRHQALLALRVAVYLVAATGAVAAPFELTTAQRLGAVLACAGAIVLHSALRYLGERFPRFLRLSVDVALVVDGAAVFLLAVLSHHLESHALWLIPPLAVAVALGLSAPTGVKALVLLAVATGAVAVAAPPEEPLVDGLPPLLVAAGCLVVTAAMAQVNEQELRWRGERVDALHDASLAFVAARSNDDLAAAARRAAQRLLPGWDVEVALGVPPGDRRAWREGGRVHLRIPVNTPSHQGFDQSEGVRGALLAHRPAPRRRDGAVTLRGQQLKSLDTLCAGLASALAQEGLLRRFERLSLVDALTGLGNRRNFDQALERELARSRRTRQPLGLVMLDVDHFKDFNDTFGHAAGDRALTAVGACLRSVGRREDQACRVGGEEFALLLPGADGPSASDVAERVRQAVKAMELPEGSITVSLGVAAALPGDDPERLVARADERLYEAKRLGRDQVVAGDGLASAAGG